MLVHGNNLRQKEGQTDKSKSEDTKKHLAEIRIRYDEWHKTNMTLIGPSATPAPDDEAIVQQRVALFQTYKDFIDREEYAKAFDSRSNLHSTVLEEFMYYLFKDLVAGFGENALIGKSHTFKDIFFVPPSYAEMLQRPYALPERKDHDFIIGTTVEALFRSKSSPAAASHNSEGEESRAGERVTLTAVEPSHYNEVQVTSDVETHLFDIPAVVIECKTYLDKNMFEGSSRAAEELKARNPNAMYIVVMEWIKLSEAANPRKYKVDQLYILRKQKNTDRELRYASSYTKNPIHTDVVYHLFNTVREHLTSEWQGGVKHAIERGWLI